MRFSDPKQRSDSARRGERGADCHHPTKSGHKRFVDYATDLLVLFRVYVFRNVDGREFYRLSLQRLRDLSRQIRAAHSVIQIGFEHMQHNDSKHCDRDQACRPRDGIVDSRCCPGTVLRDRVHDGRRQRRHCDGHA